MNLNKVSLIGRITRDPEVRTTPSGQNVATVSLATNRVWNDKSGQKQEQTEFHNIVIWGKLAEIAGQYLTKGQEVYFEGRLQTRSYTAKDGTERRVTEVIAENMQMGSRPAGNQSRSAVQTPIANNRPTAAPQATSQTPPPMEEIPTINLDEEQDDVKIDDVPF